jgi:hypothetical protein
MAKASFRDVYGKTQGRFVVSEGVAPAEYLLPSEDLPTLYLDDEDNRFEIVITKGTILAVIDDGSDNSLIVPCNGTNAPYTYTGTSRDGTATSITLAANYPIGVAQYDLYRPFEYGTSQGTGWLTHAYVEYPMVERLNDDLAPGNLICPDAIGRPVLYTHGASVEHTMCGQVICVEKFATNFDDGLLSYMEIPSDSFDTALEEVYKITHDGDYAGTFGIRGNLDVEDCLGAIRVLLKF